MNYKVKIRIIFVLMIISLLFFVVNKSYALFSSSASDDVEDVALAKFVVNNRLKDSQHLDIDGMVPGSSKEFEIKVANKNGSKISDVSIKYKITVTSVSLPLVFSLYKGSNTTNLMTCTGVYEKTCVSSEQALSYSVNTDQVFRLVVSIPQYRSDNEPFSINYANSIDIVTLKIDSWQA